VHRGCPATSNAGKIRLPKKSREEKGMEHDVWPTISAQIVSKGKERRNTHPTATCVELEDDMYAVLDGADVWISIVLMRCVCWIALIQRNP
jgi:hypothetical protein